MLTERAAGVLLHPTSLPGEFGIGDFGRDSYKFIDFLNSCGFKYWQVLPLGPTGYGDSPYQSFSAFAGNPLLISPELLFEDNLISKEELKKSKYNSKKVQYGKAIKNKFNLLRKAFSGFKKNAESNSHYFKFCEENNNWLEDYSIFMAAKDYHKGIIWRDWDEGISSNDPLKILEWRKKLIDSINFYKFVQYKFYKQWHSLKRYANGHNVKIIGDIPIFVAYDSADVWAKRNLFTIDSNGFPESVAGVPPDYFSKTGQLWGNPHYRWDVMENNNFSWWGERFSQTFNLYDLVRVDHFRGFEAFYKIPGSAKNAINGEWVKAPGEKLFDSLHEKFETLPIIAEDLGMISQEVIDLRDKFNFPGMKILQYAFGENGDKSFQPHRYIKNCVVYTGTHDNDTTCGYFENEKKNNTGVLEFSQDYINYYENNICPNLIKFALSSVADLVIFPMQDILNLGSSARMNFPGVTNGNWQWRFDWGDIENKTIENYSKNIKLYER